MRPYGALFRAHLLFTYILPTVLKNKPLRLENKGHDIFHFICGDELGSGDFSFQQSDIYRFVDLVIFPVVEMAQRPNVPTSARDI
jgi:hypothetical protein